MYSRYSDPQVERFTEIIEKLIDRKFKEFFDRLEKGLNKDDLIGIKEACTILGITRATLHNWIKDNCIYYFKKGGRYYFNRLYINNLCLFYKSNGLNVRKPDWTVNESVCRNY